MFELRRDCPAWTDDILAKADPGRMIVFIPPMPPSDPKLIKAETDYRREQAKRGGIVSDIAVSLIELFKLLFRLISWLPRIALRWWSKRRAAQVR